MWKSTPSKSATTTLMDSALFLISKKRRSQDKLDSGAGNAKITQGASKKANRSRSGERRIEYPVKAFFSFTVSVSSTILLLISSRIMATAGYS